jgi:hypothetical protein
VLSSRLETAAMEQGSAASDFGMPRHGHGFIPWGGGAEGQVRAWARTWGSYHAVSSRCRACMTAGFSRAG